MAGTSDPFRTRELSAAGDWVLEKAHSLALLLNQFPRACPELYFDQRSKEKVIGGILRNLSPSGLHRGVVPLNRIADVALKMAAV
jgi:hypothetical protein